MRRLGLDIDDVSVRVDAFLVDRQSIERSLVLSPIGVDEVSWHELTYCNGTRAGQVELYARPTKAVTLPWLNA